ncbi:hypothetical protein [Thermocoleostomius sinensis]|uniref:Uncharacterized protein n=1 Tax=Thermocoleostomius sinensis A174 TaxID=2016057 RepID=A0A9E8ZHQ1_9CYAN|nr:hypothetical protein [Thermocoleostomius sinensis]WAL61493.1 hypothetical protein OXH18_05755 [Thermocoleostomius sinensis A174]
MNLHFSSPFNLMIIPLGTVVLLTALFGVKQVESHFNQADTSHTDTALTENAPLQPALEEPIAPGSSAWCDGRFQDCPN